MTLTTLKEKARAEWKHSHDIGGIQSWTQVELMWLDSVIDRTYHATKEEVRGMPAFKNLKEEQGQLDEDGIMVAVSRQALDELLAALEDTTTSPTVS